MADVVITEFMAEEAVGALRAKHDTIYDPELWSRRSDLLSLVADARALVVRNKTKVDEELLAAGSALEVIGRLGVGLDNIDLDACARGQVHVRPAVGANATAVAEYVIGASLMLVRGVFASTADVAAGRWPREELVGGELAGRTMGLLGMGAVARAVARRAAGMGMRVVGHDPFLAADDEAWASVGRCDDLSELWPQSDVLSVHVPLTEHTRGLVDTGAMALLPTGAVVINTSRGGIVDEAAVVQALRDGRLGGAALDVFTEEPLGDQAGRAFADVPNLLLTPHVAGVTRESNMAVSRVVAEFVLEVLG